MPRYYGQTDRLVQEFMGIQASAKAPRSTSEWPQGFNAAPPSEAEGLTIFFSGWRIAHAVLGGGVPGDCASGGPVRIRRHCFSSGGYREAAFLPLCGGFCHFLGTGLDGPSDRIAESSSQSRAQRRPTASNSRFDSACLTVRYFCRNFPTLRVGGGRRHLSCEWRVLGVVCRPWARVVTQCRCGNLERFPHAMR